MGVGCRIYKDFKRPDAKLVESFKGIPVANIDDCMGRTAACRPEIVPMGGKKEICGVAFTVKTCQGDNLFVHKAMDLAKPGDVLVIDAGGSSERAILGELMVTYCKAKGIGALIIDGKIRDAEELAEMDYAVYATGATPDGPYKNGPGEINVPVSIGGRVVFPGDIVVADGDGVLFLRPADAPEVLDAVLNVEKYEAHVKEEIAATKQFTRAWLEPKLESLKPEVYDMWEEK